MMVWALQPRPCSLAVLKALLLHVAGGPDMCTSLDSGACVQLLWEEGRGDSWLRYLRTYTAGVKHIYRKELPGSTTSRTIACSRPHLQSWQRKGQAEYGAEMPVEILAKQLRESGRRDEHSACGGLGRDANLLNIVLRVAAATVFRRHDLFLLLCNPCSSASSPWAAVAHQGASKTA